jgi:hypothetical protein
MAMMAPPTSGLSALNQLADMLRGVQVLPQDPPIGRNEMFGGGGMEVPERKDAPTRQSLIQQKDAAFTERVAPMVSMTPVPGVNNPAGMAAWFGRNIFGAPMGGPPAKASVPPPIGEQTFEGSPAPSTSAPPPIGQQLSGGKPDGESGGSAATPRGSSAPSSPGQMAPTPSGSPSGNNDLAKFMLQMGLSLMVPRWGGPLANIGMAAGEGAEAVGRAKKEEQETAMGQKKLELEQARIDKMGNGRRATESSRSKRVKEKKPLEAFGENLSPEATLYFQQRLKNLKGESEVTNPDGTTATLSEADQYNAILRETKVIDARSRAARGMARSDEIPEDKLRQHVGTANEIAIMNTVAADPVQRAILMQRIENIKRAKAATNANTPAAAKPK